jgi:hypothetical protein
MEDNLVYLGFCVILCTAVLGLYLFFFRYRSHKSENPRWWKLLLGNFLVLFFAVALVGLLGETYYRFWYDRTDALWMTKTSRDWLWRHFLVNRAGMRDNREYWKNPPADMTRITFLGDSFTVAHGVSNVDDRFANRVRKMHPEWDVLVMAWPGFETGDELTKLRQMIKDGYGLDRVVLVYCLNDIDDVIPYEAGNLSVTLKHWPEGKPGFLIEHSYLLNTLYYRILLAVSPRIPDYDRREHDAYFGRPWESQERRLKAVRDLVTAHGGKLYVVTFPWMQLIGPDYAFRDVHQRLDDFWRSLGVPHLDLLPAYEPYPPGKLVVNANDAHPNEFAHGLAADVIARFLEKQIQREKKGPAPSGSSK